MKKLVIVAALLVGPALLYGQGQATGGLDPAEIMKPLADQWTSYSGDLSGKRFGHLGGIEPPGLSARGCLTVKKRGCNEQ